jgi:hypothetical protein
VKRFKSARPRRSYIPKDTRHFPRREWLCLAADFSARRILSCVLQDQKSPMLRGSLGIAGYYLQIQTDTRLHGGPSRDRTILHLRIQSTNPISRSLARWDFPSPKGSSFSSLSCHQKGHGCGKVVESWYSTGISPTTPKWTEAVIALWHWIGRIA